MVHSLNRTSSVRSNLNRKVTDGNSTLLPSDFLVNFKVNSFSTLRIFSNDLQKAELLDGKLYRGPLKVPEIQIQILQIQDPFGNVLGFESSI